MQDQIAKRKQIGLHNSSAGIFSSKLICDDCGSFFGSKVWHSNTKYRRTIWQCRQKFKNSKKCGTPHFYEDELKASFLKAFNQIIENKEQILNDCKILLLALTNTDELDEKIRQTQQKYDDSMKLLESYINQNATSALDQNEYNQKYEKYFESYEKEKSELESLQNLRACPKTFNFAINISWINIIKRTLVVKSHTEMDRI